MEKLHQFAAVIALVLGMVHTGLSFAKGEEFSYEKVEKKENKRPSGCRDTGYLFDLKTLQLVAGSRADKQSLYVMYNYSPKTIQLFQMLQQESSRSMYLNQSIQPEYWTAFATSERPVHFICTIPQAGSLYGEIVDCSEHIRVCEYVNVKFGLNNRGNFWLANSSTRNGTVKGIVYYGIIPDYQVSDKSNKKDKKVKSS